MKRHGPYSTFEWIGDRLNGLEIREADGQRAWTLHEKLCERNSVIQEDETSVCYAVGVFNCSDTNGVEPPVIMKIWMQ